MDRLKFRRPGVARMQIISYLIGELSGFLDNNLTFAQVGGNDGQLDDPISQIAKTRNWKGLIFEPVPTYFEKLKQNYEGHENIECINFACSNEKGKLEIYYIDPEKSEHFPSWLQGCASMDPERLVAHLERLNPNLSKSDINGLIKKYVAPVTTLNNALEDHELDELDLLVIDVEGHEVEVVKGFEIEKYHPKMALIENNGTDKKYESDVIKPWQAQGYDALRIGDDLAFFQKGMRWLSGYDFARILGNTFSKLGMEAK